MPEQPPSHQRFSKTEDVVVGSWAALWQNRKLTDNYSVWQAKKKLYCLTKLEEHKNP